jgi:hypothetical protein
MLFILNILLILYLPDDEIFIQNRFYFANLKILQVKHSIIYFYNYYYYYLFIYFFFY